KLILIALLLFSIGSFAQGGSGGNNGGPSIILKYQNLDIAIPDGFSRFLEDPRDVYFKDIEPLKEVVVPAKCARMEDDAKELCLILHEERSTRTLISPIDLEIKGAGIIDIQSFKDQTPKSLWREENGELKIDKRVPVINWQDLDGELHELK
ncbi:MAG: hypothetical protein NXH75_07105, partial [Halobacteriovoraceae bacterium]|nr:hypothetical protein [Halobacteriovoraceae bacterium]